MPGLQPSSLMTSDSSGHQPHEQAPHQEGHVGEARVAARVGCRHSRLPDALQAGMTQLGHLQVCRVDEQTLHPPRTALNEAIHRLRLTLSARRQRSKGAAHAGQSCYPQREVLASSAL